MNEKSEQIDSGLNYVLDYDQPLDWRKDIFAAVTSALVGKKCIVEKIGLSDGNHKILRYCPFGDVEHCFLLAAVTFLGGSGNHPIFKKRIQLKTWYKEAYYKFSSRGCRVHFMGVYHYKGNILFVDFEPETFIANKMHNSSAFVYTNDLYRAMKDGIAFRRDFNGHGVTTITKNKLAAYLSPGKCTQVVSSTDDLVHIFEDFNSAFPFLKWIKGINAIREMADNDWPDWRQTEWAGWFLEYKFSNYLDKHDVKSIVYCKNKKKNGGLDFDLWFPVHKFYGDLKASDTVKDDAPGNDQEAFLEAINRYDRFWYAVYEHETVKDSDSKQKFAVERAEFIITRDGVTPVPSKNKNHRDLKYKVCFNRMLILEVNRFNYQDMLKTFNQGRQPDGKPRRKKFLVRKHLPVALENYQILHYAPLGRKSGGMCYSSAGKCALSISRKSTSC